MQDDIAKSDACGAAEEKIGFAKWSPAGERARKGRDGTEGEQQKGREGKFDDHQNSVNVVQVSFRSIALC